MVLLHLLHVLSYFRHAVSDLLDLGGVRGVVTVVANSDWLPPSITRAGGIQEANGWKSHVKTRKPFRTARRQSLNSHDGQRDPLRVIYLYDCGGVNAQQQNPSGVKLLPSRPKSPPRRRRRKRTACDARARCPGLTRASHARAEAHRPCAGVRPHLGGTWQGPAFSAVILYV